jgi:hydroxyacylglutathione hydrolase
MPLQIELIPAFADNYIYLLRETENGTVAVVDPGDAGPVIEKLEAEDLPLHLILLTHHHADHIGGLQRLKQQYGAEAVGPAADNYRIEGLDRTVTEGDEVAIGALTADVIETPGHTAGHIAFHVPAAQALFSGDTLFSLGCGRLFEGTPEQMWASLTKLRALPDETQIYCGHEYTLSNARFARSIDPDNAALAERAAEVEALREADKPTIPALLSTEKAANPFLRADISALQHALGRDGDDPVEVFAEIRQRKNNA